METQTPIQKSMPKHVQKIAYTRVPITCDKLRAILDDCKRNIMHEFNIELSDDASLDIHITQAFLRIRDEITHPFRDEQMQLIQK